MKRRPTWALSKGGKPWYKPAATAENLTSISNNSKFLAHESLGHIFFAIFFAGSSFLQINMVSEISYHLTVVSQWHSFSSFHPFMKLAKSVLTNPAQVTNSVQCSTLPLLLSFGQDRKTSPGIENVSLSLQQLSFCLYFCIHMTRALRWNI